MSLFSRLRTRTTGLTSGLASRAGHANCFEPLEDRRMLAAATYASNALSPTDWTIVVRYTDPQGIDVDTLGDNDIRVTGPGYAINGDFQNFVYDQADNPNSVRAIYKVPAKGFAWDYTDNGAYHVAMLANGVADTGGEAVPASNLRDFNLFFRAPKAQLLSTSTTETADNMRFVVNMRYSDNVGINPETIGFGEVGLVNPDNPDVTLFLPGQTFNQNPDGSWTVQYRLPAPGGSWDWTDTGTYHVRIRGGLVADTETPANTIPEHTLASYFLRFSQPKAEIATQTVTATDWRVTVRYTDDQGIDVNSLGAGDVFVANGLETVSGRSISGVVMENGNRSVRVTYSLKATPGIPWSHEDNRTNIIFSNFGHVRDTAGNLIGREELKRYNLWFNTPAALVGPTFFNSSITATGPWEFDMRYTDNRSINFDSIGNGDLRLQNDTGYLQQATLVSKRSEFNPLTGRDTIIARYRFTPGAARWVDGNYRVVINANQISDNQGVSMPSYIYKTMVIDF